MSNLITISSINQAHKLLALPKPEHPLVSVFQSKVYEAASVFDNTKVVLDLYRITLKSSNYKGHIQYGRNSYDYEEGSLIFSAPGQMMEYGSEVESGGDIEGWTLVFHPDLIRRHELSKKISQYSFFNYELTEALHLSDKERKAIEEIVGKIINEYSQNLDHYSHHLIVSNIQLLLDYCLRFYDRQFLIRSNLNAGIIAQFERELRAYYQSELVAQEGLPTVAYLGKVLNKSPHYLSDLLKKETGKTAQEHIHLFILEMAKNNLLNSSKPIREIAYMLGFDYPQYFSNLFKSKIGLSPSEYRRLG